MKNQPKYILVHGSDASYRSIPDQMRAIDVWHAARDFPISDTGHSAGYHSICTGGVNYRPRRDDEEGAHCNQKEGGISLNFQSLGVCIGFAGDIEMPLPMDYINAQEQVWAWQDKYKIPNERVRFHRYYANKTCPGKLITDQWLKDFLKRPEPIVVKPVENLCFVEKQTIAEQKFTISNLKYYIAILTSLFRRS